MSRVSIEFPEQTIFATQIVINQTHINLGNHVGNSQYVELCNEASLRFFEDRGVAQYTVGEQMLLNNEFAVQIKSETRCSDRLNIELSVDNFHRFGCDFIFRLSQYKPSEEKHGQVVALAKFSFLCFDYQQAKIVQAGPLFNSFFNA